MQNTIKKKHLRQFTQIESSNMKSICINSQGSIDKRQVVQFLLIPLWDSLIPYEYTGPAGSSPTVERQGDPRNALKKVHHKSKPFLREKENKHMGLKRTDSNFSNKQSHFFLLGSVPFSVPGPGPVQKNFGFLDYRPLGSVPGLKNSLFDKKSSGRPIDYSKNSSSVVLNTPLTGPCLAMVGTDPAGPVPGESPLGSPASLNGTARKNPTFLAYWLLPFLGLLPLLSSDKNNLLTPAAPWPWSGMVGPDHGQARLMQNMRVQRESPGLKGLQNHNQNYDWENCDFITQDRFKEKGFYPSVKTSLVECYLKEIYALNQGRLTADKHIALTTRINTLENAKMNLPFVKTTSPRPSWRSATYAASEKLGSLAKYSLSKESVWSVANKQVPLLPGRFFLSTSSYALKTANFLGSALNATCFSSSDSDSLSIHYVKPLTPSQLQKEFNLLFFSQVKDLNWTCVVGTNHSHERAGASSKNPFKGYFLRRFAGVLEKASKVYNLEKLGLTNLGNKSLDTWNITTFQNANKKDSIVSMVGTDPAWPWSGPTMQDHAGLLGQKKKQYD